MNVLLQQLQRDGVITEDEARVAQFESASKGVSCSTVLLQAEFVSSELLKTYGDQSLAVSLNAAEFVPDHDALCLIDERMARELCALPMTLDSRSNELLVVMGDLANVVARDRIRRAIAPPVQVNFCQAKAIDIRQALDKCYGNAYTLSAVLTEIHQRPDEFTSELEQSNAPVVRLIDALLQDAVSQRASDIHLSPESTHIQIRYRVDGVLRKVCCLHRRYWSAMLVRIKVLSDLDIAETRLPQDGHLARIIHGSQIDFRVSSFPLNSGENLVLRVLDRRQGLLTIDQLCHGDDKTVGMMRSLVNRPNGLTMVCGPTGAGKTTTLYALLRSLDNTSLNIMTLEDPVEYPIAKIRQTRVNRHTMDFAEGVRGVLRQDPDVIMVGEVRDADSCSMSCRAALTGHLVLSSTHANSAIGAIGRLLELGASRSVLADVLTGVVSQRLIRKVCASCNGQQSHCRVCLGVGYSGRLALFECLSVTDAFAEALQRGDSFSALTKLAIEQGLQTLQQQASDYLRRGQTTAEEIARALGDKN